MIEWIVVPFADSLNTKRGEICEFELSLEYVGRYG